MCLLLGGLSPGLAPLFVYVQESTRSWIQISRIWIRKTAHGPASSSRLFEPFNELEMLMCMYFDFNGIGKNPDSDTFWEAAWAHADAREGCLHILPFEHHQFCHECRMLQCFTLIRCSV